MRCLPFLLLGLLLLETGSAVDSAEAPRPNIVVFFADDMGYSDIGCFGSEIETPTLDRLAAGGLRFTHFYNAGRCCPSRASILTGLYPHQAGIGHMAGDLSSPGYRDRLDPRAVTLAEVLGTAGYHTIMTGKWHLGWRDEGSPTERGFQQFYGTRGYIDSYFTIVPRTEIYLGDEMVIPVTENPVNHLHPEREWYTTDVFTDYALHFIDQVRKNDDAPFFLYLAYNAPHFPLHAKPEDVEKYRGRYREGWEVFRRRRYERLVEMGVVEPGWELSPPDVPGWSSLTEQQRDDLDFKMALYAAIIDRLDRNIGRVVADLERRGELDNTLIIFLSDNGGTRETGLFGIQGEAHTVANYDEWARVGGWTSSYGQGWANLSNVPFRRYKRESHEGAIATPFVVHWPDGIGKEPKPAEEGRLVDVPCHLIDLMPTVVEVGGATYPQEFEGRDILPMEGRSLVPLFEDPGVKGGDLAQRTLYWEHEGNRAIREGDRKLVALRGGPWELYDMTTDRTELHDLADAEPARAAVLQRRWEDWAESVSVLSPEEFEQARREARKPRPEGKAKGDVPE